MRRIGGRRRGVAWPSGLVCVAVVAGLLWLAVPGVPGAIGFAGDVLRAGTAAAAAGPEAPIPTIGSVATTDCRSLYPDRLWGELTWTPDVLLAQDGAAPALAEPALGETLAPAVLLSCRWTAPQGSVATSVVDVGPDAVAATRESVAGHGYACRGPADATVCTRAEGGVDEEIEIRGGRLVATAYRGWHPLDYGAAVAGRVWR